MLSRPLSRRLLLGAASLSIALSPVVAQQPASPVNGWGVPATDVPADPSVRLGTLPNGMFAGIGIRLIDFKLEFGRVYDGDYSRIILADEISPDGCRLWDMIARIDAGDAKGALRRPRPEPKPAAEGS